MTKSRNEKKGYFIFFKKSSEAVPVRKLSAKLKKLVKVSAPHQYVLFSFFFCWNVGAYFLFRRILVKSQKNIRREEILKKKKNKP